MSKHKQKAFHYYPVSLQEHFTYTNDGQVYVYPVKHLREGKMKVFGNNQIRNICQIRHYNRKNIEDTYFTPMETDLSPKVRNIIERFSSQDDINDPVIDESIEQTISELISYLSLNHPFTRKKWLEVVKSVRFYCKKCREYTVSTHGLSIKSMDKLYLETKSLMIERLEAYRFGVIRTNKDALITTDYPVVFYTSHKDHGTYYANDFDSKSLIEPNIPFSWELPQYGRFSRHDGETVLHNVKNKFTAPHYIYLPITPKLAFLCIRRDIEDTIFPEGGFYEDKPDNISFLNQINLLTAYEKGISNNEELLIKTIESVKNIIDEL